MGQLSIRQEAHGAAAVRSSRDVVTVPSARICCRTWLAVLTALRERGAAVADVELRAGQELREMTGRRVCR